MPKSGRPSVTVLLARDSTRGEMTDSVFRVLPTFDEPSAFFWTSGADGKLRFLRCSACSYLIHPPAPICPQCDGRDAAPAEVSGRGTVHSLHGEPPAVGRHQRRVRDRARRRSTSSPTCASRPTSSASTPTTCSIGMPVEVVFEDHDPVFVPLFRPVAPMTMTSRTARGHLGDRAVGDRTPPRPRRARPHDRGGARRDRRRRPHASPTSTASPRTRAA